MATPLLVWFLWLVALFLTGLAIRLLDDALDQAEDREAGVPNLAGRLGGGAVAYGLAALALGALILPGVAPAALLAAYAVGMAGSLAERLPTRVPAWVETAGVTVLLFLLTPPLVAVWALTLMGALQAADRYLEGRLPGRSSGAAPSPPPPRGSPGQPEATGSLRAAAGALGLGLLAMGLAPGLTLAALVAATALELCFKQPGRGIARV